jgi:hypothetical protein
MPQFVIPVGINQTTANLLQMQINIMQTLIANQMVQMEKRLDYKRWERKQLAKELANRNNCNLKVNGKAPNFNLKKDRDNFKTWKLKWNDCLVSSNTNSINRVAIKEDQPRPRSYPNCRMTLWSSWTNKDSTQMTCERPNS